MSAIAKLRRKRKLTQRQIATALDIDVSTVRNWEKSKDGVQMFRCVAKLCALLNCSPDELTEVVEPDQDAEE